MDAALLTTHEFWLDPQPFAAAEIPNLPELTGHVLFETSGTTGDPKWVALTKQALLVSATAVNHHLQVTCESCWGLALPLHHVGGFGVAARAFVAGCRLEESVGRWGPVAFIDWLARTGVTHTSLVPTQVHDLVKTGRRAPPTLTAIVVGGGHLDPATGQAARDLGWPVLASYGMSEAASQIATQALDQLAAPYRSAPLPLLPIWQARTDPDGRLSISGPALFSGYVRNHQFYHRSGEWYQSSDLAQLELDKLTLIGRADTLVKVLGELVDPESIERELAALSHGHLILGNFAVIAIPDPRAGSLLLPVFDSSVSAATIATILALYEKQAIGFRKLAPPTIVASLPRSSLGKLKRADLAAILGTRKV